MVTVDEAWAQLEAAWHLAERANAWLADHDQAAWDRLWEAVFAKAEGLDHGRSAIGFNQDPPEVYFQTAFGLQFRPDLARWVPRRHGALEIEPWTG